MRIIKNGYADAETFPLPCWHNKSGILQYSSEFADKLISQAYGDDPAKYEIDPRSLELFYIISDKMKFKIAEVTYESYFTDIKGKEFEAEFREMWSDDFEDPDPEGYEIYNITIYHYSHPSLKSNLIDSSGKLKGFESAKYIKSILKNLERRDEEDEWSSLDEDDDYYK